jgi:thiamine biosynthesis lipoprotein
MKKLIFILPLILFACQPKSEQKPAYIQNTGETQGTYYNIIYEHPSGKDLGELIEMKLKEFDLSLSTYNPKSVISAINRNDSTILTDSIFDAMFNQAMRVSELSGGAFDITVGPLVKAWGFGFDAADRSKSPDVDTILPYVGYQKVKLVNRRVIKSDQRIRLDAGAIAQGQSSDFIGSVLENQGCKNYMVEIGGEVFCKGVNRQGKKWQIGIDKPYDDPADMDKELQAVVAISGVGLSTSGNYRQFYERDGKKFAHEINPHTGKPVDHNLLSATVIAPSCMESDAFATAFMVLGLEKSLTLCKNVPGLECYLIYADKDGKFQVAQSEGFKKYLTE